MSNTKEWTTPNENDEIDVPDELMPLFNQIGTQVRLHTISGKNEVLTIAHCVRNAQKFFQSRISELEAENERLREVATTAFRELELLKNEYKRLREALIDAKEDAAALIEQHRWIPVTERLPEDEGIYLVLCPKYVADPIVVRWNNKGWFDNELDFHEDITDHVTHWIAIPQPPKEQ